MVPQIQDNQTTATSSASQQADEFKIRTLNRRHLDFDSEYDLSDLKAPERSKWTEPWCFIQAADTQFGMIDSYIKNRTEPGWDEEIELSTTLVSVINRMQPRPKFLIICGDLLDAMPDVKGELRKLEIADFKKIFSKLNIPLVCVCGNHDVGNEPTIENIETYKKDFGDDYFHFTTSEVLFIVINSQFYEHRGFVEDYASVQDTWLESILEKCKLFKYSIIFEHIPWFLQSPDEEDEYFNINKETRLKWLRKFKDAGVTKIMCGHYHRNAGGWFEGMELIVTSAIGAQCGDDKSGARIVLMLDKTIEHKYFSIDELRDYDKNIKDWVVQGLSS